MYVHSYSGEKLPSLLNTSLRIYRPPKVVQATSLTQSYCPVSTSKSSLNLPWVSRIKPLPKWSGELSVNFPPADCMKKLFSAFLLIGLFFPVIVEAGPRCKKQWKIVVCGMPRKPKKCTRKRPCIPKGYYRPNPPRVIPMG